jgi:hypothetical protein
MNPRRSRWPDVAILLAALIMAVVAVRWADAEFRRVQPTTAPARNLSRPNWVGASLRPFERLMNAWVWVCVSATVGVWAVAVRDPKSWRRPGTVVVTVALLVGVVTAVHLLVGAAAIFRRNGLCYGLRNALEARVPGAIIGAWAITWGRKHDWASRVVSGMWMGHPGMLVAHALLFG